MVVQARTLEFYRQLGIADDVVAGGVAMRRIHLRRGGEELGQLRISEIGEDLSPFPYVLCYPQDDHERLLVEKLRDAGVEVEWNVELTGLEQRSDGVRALLRSPVGEETCEVEYLCGCDGAHSAVRHALGIDFGGGDYDDLFYVADVKIAAGFETAGYANLSQDAFALMLPVRSSGMQRLIGIVPRDLAGRSDLTYEDIRDQVEPLVGAHATQVNWFATYRVHHRVAERFGSGRCFLAGDAAHIHSPAGGQGMNTGIGDAFNLAWKLADALQGRASSSILETYEAERLPFARRLVATTDRAFRWISGRGFESWAFRSLFLPAVVPLATRFSRVRRLLFRTISQILVAYPQSPLSSGRAGAVAGGDRLPWTAGGASDNFAFLRSCDWQVHVYGSAERSFREEISALGATLHELPWSDAAATAGFRRNAAYLVRPDGYVALAVPDQDVRPFREFVRRFGLRFGDLPAA
jgi:2-polyprenyl-6-methoxyphenol hydroxylase-like FAD-dependent oxidoreductase